MRFETLSDNNTENNEPARSPDEIYEAAKAGIEELWKSGQINFGLATQLTFSADRVFKENKQKHQDKQKQQIVYVRKFPCALCKKEVTATKILDGYLIECNCVPAFSPGDSIETNSWYRLRDCEE